MNKLALSIAALALATSACGDKKAEAPTATTDAAKPAGAQATDAAAAAAPAKKDEGGW